MRWLRRWWLLFCYGRRKRTPFYTERPTRGAMFANPRRGGGSHWLWQFKTGSVAPIGLRRGVSSPPIDPPRGAFNAWDRSLGARVWYTP